MKPSIRLLLVEDNAGDARLLREMLKEQTSHVIEVTHVQRMQEAENYLRAHAVEVILLDLGLPDAQGLETIRRIRAAVPHVPVVMLTVLDDEQMAAKALHSGAQDYLIKGQTHSRELLRSLLFAIDRNFAELALHESELRFRQLAETIRDVFFIFNLSNSKVFYISPAYEEVWGRSCASLYAQPASWADSVHPDDRDYSMAQITGGRTTGFDYEYRIIRPDREVRWIQARGFPVRDETGKAYRIAGVASDITRRRQAADELRESERRFSALLGTVTLISLMLDQYARITYCNDYLLRLTGWQREELLGRDWFDLFVPAPHDALRKTFTTLLANAPEAWHHESEILTRSGARRLVRWNNSVLRSSAGEVIGTASIGEDVTQQKEAARKIKRLNQVHAVSSGITALTVRVRDRHELFREACRVAVEDGRFLMAWIGVVDREAGVIRRVASAGDVTDFFETAPAAMFTFSAEGAGLASQAIVDMKPVIAQHGGKLAQGSTAQELTARGIHSLAFIPLVAGSEAIGVFALCAAQAEGFSDEEEMKLLIDLADNISIGLEHLQKSERLNYLAYYDPLTGLANRTLFLDRVAQMLNAEGDPIRKVAVFALDIERFKTVNEALGRPAGDELLIQIADRLRKIGTGSSHFTGVAGDRFSALRSQSHLGRVAADHFAIVSTEAQDDEQFAHFTEAMLKECFGMPFRIRDSEVRISAKVGIAVFPTDGADAETLLSHATAAVRKAKASGEHYSFYAQEMNERSTTMLTLENKLRLAYEKEEFVLHYQPKIDLESRRIVGVEALIRWESPDQGLVPPIQFISLMEETGLILEVGAWALSKAAADHLRWKEMQLPAPRVAVNVSAIQLRKRDFVRTVVDAVQRGASTPGIDLEITESLVMENIEANIEKLKEVRALGLSIAIDDFGTGYSSLAYLAKLPVQTLKIDRSFVNTMLDDRDTMTMVQMIISLAHSLRLKVIAEGVESEEQARMLHLLHCDEMQGYLFSKAIPFDAMTRLLFKSEDASGLAAESRLALAKRD